MKFDDRLATIITTPVTDAHDLVVRWRQLVDLVSRAGAGAAGPQIDEALAVIGRGRDAVPVTVRAAAARSIAGRGLPPGLLALFAADRLEVAAPLMASVQIDDHLRAAASPDVRRFLDALHAPTAPDPTERAVLKPVETMPSIGEVVARIEQLRASRAGEGDMPAPALVSETLPPSPPSLPPSPPRAAPAPPLALPAPSASPALFRWECGAGGEIAWVEGAPRGPLVGRSIARAIASDGVGAEVERAFGRRAPFRDAALALPEAGAVAGDWLISGDPAFANDDGRFVGYRGFARRADGVAPDDSAPAATPLDPAALRELVHEIKTPLNAIIGFAEIIDGQYLGPAQSAYRARAAEIVAQARILLTAVDDLDFAARARAGSDVLDRAELASFFGAFLKLFRAEATARGVAVAIDAPLDQQSGVLDRVLSERLLDRFAQAVVALARPSETLKLSLRIEGRTCAVRLSRPRALEGLGEDDLFGGTGNEHLPLRLVAGLARMAGGRLTLEPGDLRLGLPIVG